MFNHIQQTYLLFSIFSAILVIASTIGFILKRKAGSQPAPVIDNLNAVINAWWVMLIVPGVAIILGKTAFIILFGIISLFALREFISLLPTRRGDYFPLLIAFYFVIPYRTTWYIPTGTDCIPFLFHFMFFYLVPIAALKAEDTTHFLERSAKIQWGLMVSVFCISHVPALLNLKLPGFDGEKIWWQSG